MGSVENRENEVDTPASRKRVYGYLCGILSGMAYGTNPLFALPLMRDYHMPVDTILFYRYASAAVCMLIWVVWRRQYVPLKFDQSWLLGLLGIFFGLSSLLLFTAYNYIPSGIATTIIYLEPVMVALIMVAMKQYPTWQKWLAIAVSFAGVVLLCQGDGLEGTYDWFGLLLAFLSALSYAFYMVIVNCSKRISRVSGTFLSLITLVIGSLLFFVHSLPEGIGGIPDWKAFGLVLGAGLVPTIGSLVTMTYATRSVGATTTAVLGVMEPITAIGIGVMLFNESLTVYIIFGFILTAGAIVFMTLTDKKSETC